MTVVIADDEAIVRTGVRLILDGESDIEVVGEAADGEAAIAVVERLRPDIALLDVRMPGMSGLEAAQRILGALTGGACRVIMLTTFDLDEYVYSALAAGASGFLLKDGTAEELVAAIRQVAAGAALLAPSLTRRLIERFVKPGPVGFTPTADLESLTRRELEVLRLMARGFSNSELAAVLALSEGTVKTHVARILSKLGIRDRVQAVVLAYESGLVQPGMEAP
ncbi:MAG: response regulator transcription factor [Chloroflexota bacterium]|nr:response regulator transcription factor [Chloroflexota bacterium]